MIDGRPVKVKWNQYIAPGFLPQIPKSDPKKWRTCGSATLQLLTGRPAHLIEKDKPRNQSCWTAASITNYLTGCGYKVVPVTKNSVTLVNDWEHFPLDSLHVVLFSAQVDKNEASWFVSHNWRLWHNLYEMTFSPLFFLNKPTQDVMLVWHPKWA